MIILATIMLLELGLHGPPVPVGEPEEVRVLERKLTEAWREHRSITYKIKCAYVIEERITPIPGGISRQKGGTRFQEGTVEELRKGERILYHWGTSSLLIGKNGKRDPDEDHLSVVICDGKNVYEHVKFLERGKEAVGKSPYAPPYSPSYSFERARESYALKLLPKDEIDGERVYVIEGTRLKGSKSKKATLLMCYRNDGICVMHVELNEEGEALVSVKQTNIKTDVKIDPDRFVFHPPPGVEIQILKEKAALVID